MTMRRDVHDELRARLHEAAEAHEPDRARMLARVERGMSAAAQDGRRGHRATRPAVLGWARIVGATAAVAGMLAVGGYAVASAVKGDGPAAQETVAVSPTPAELPDATSRPPESSAPSPSSGGGGGKSESLPTPSGASGGGSASPAPAADAPPAASVRTDGPLSAAASVDPHSNEFWAQSDITLKTTAQLTALTVQLKVAQTGSVTSTGAWRSLPEDDFTFTLAEQGGFVVYTWVLKEGRTVYPGEWVFAGQYDHARGGRDAKDDVFAVSGTAGGKGRAVGGGFGADGGS